MRQDDLCQALADYSLQVSREQGATRRGIVVVGMASLLALSGWLMALSLDRHDPWLTPVAHVRQPPPSPPVTLHPLPVELWQPGVTP